MCRLSWWEVAVKFRFSRVVFTLAGVVACIALGPSRGDEPKASGASNLQEPLWQKLEAAIQQIDRRLDGVLGVAILDLTSRRKWALHGDGVFPQASSIKIVILAELYRQD